jgi:hypothetical protein
LQAKSLRDFITLTTLFSKNQSFHPFEVTKSQTPIGIGAINSDIKAGSCHKRRSSMKKNVGSIDRFIRVAVGLGLLSLAFVGPQTALGWIGLVPIVTGLASRCPLYRLLGIHTCQTSRNV